MAGISSDAHLLRHARSVAARRRRAFPIALAASRMRRASSCVPYSGPQPCLRRAARHSSAREAAVGCALVSSRQAARGRSEPGSGGGAQAQQNVPVLQHVAHGHATQPRGLHAPPGVNLVSSPPRPLSSIPPQSYSQQSALPWPHAPKITCKPAPINPGAFPAQPYFPGKARLRCGGRKRAPVRGALHRHALSIHKEQARQLLAVQPHAVPRRGEVQLRGGCHQRHRARHGVVGPRRQRCLVSQDRRLRIDASLNLPDDAGFLSSPQRPTLHIIKPSAYQSPC